ncbi:flagellar hook-basal body complex protein FliE [Aliarcobacter cibarius]|jgi:flagellar hook-basal body complex protein FliE|uniref:Flagellar hook-basal body complex protein FliE n=1 Tax=Aliarcobacter cibarius TaxID=255507 RepID=A0A5J6RIL8_9BACT|nr:flagellar hook-basal body complex protein FliE [Aliarcobacter cibarius]QEZ88558.1 flagellar proximal rod protein FliE [Aliarcobacter cibarius]QKJ26597.1 flagellar proximal rod protein FliE [Aliarcobacter cibarius]TLS98952.1 flagellar hook-basal body complex protein FliE [Aliarcobacter cibarius]TLS99868.1 flagellar hook-basal body complex protein FliE [Aliarcobacter cibarius]TLT03775.1 flagellar hook-basal body complex protein FliE [Aliarcobacter cibarius]
MNVSSIINSLNDVKLDQSNKIAQPLSGNTKSFQELLNNSLNELNDEQIEGYNAMQGIATGKVTNLQEAVQRIEEAELSLKLALEVKNKAINAYKEITRMQI